MDGWVLRFRVEGEERVPHRVRAYADGRLERCVPEAGGGPEIVTSTGSTSVDTVRRAVALAERVSAAERPVLGAGHDPTQRLELAWSTGGAPRAWTFRWGRASPNDAPLEPVADEAIGDFNALYALLQVLERAARTVASR